MKRTLVGTLLVLAFMALAFWPVKLFSDYLTQKSIIPSKILFVLEDIRDGKTQYYTALIDQSVLVKDQDRWRCSNPKKEVLEYTLMVTKNIDRDTGRTSYVVTGISGGAMFRIVNFIPETVGVFETEKFNISIEFIKTNLQQLFLSSFPEAKTLHCELIPGL